MRIDLLVALLVAGFGGVASAAPAACDLAGDYRLRYHSNGTDGWWLRLRIAGDKATVTEKSGMLGLEPGAIALVADGCKATLSAKTEEAGDLRVVFTLDPATDSVAGQLTRTKSADNAATATTPLLGRRGATPGPACLKPGVYELAIAPRTRWRLSQGRPRFGNTCGAFGWIARATVRIEPFGDEILVDEVESQTYGQSFQRGEVVRKGDCQIDLKLEVQDFKLDSTLTFAGDAIKGTARTTTYQFMEDGEAGENLWACSAKKASVVGKRLGD